jgi:hypothetical protein
MVKHLQKILKEFNPCLQMHKLDLRRLKISSLFQKRGESTTPVELLDSQLNLVADYLNTSLNCIQNNYNRHKTQLKNALTLLQPVSKEMGEAFEQFKGITGSLTEDTMKEAPKKFDRYVRKTLEHEQDCKKWKANWKHLKRRIHHIPPLMSCTGRWSRREREKKPPRGTLIRKKMKFLMKWICMNKSSKICLY